MLLHLGTNKTNVFRIYFFPQFISITMPDKPTNMYIKFVNHVAAPKIALTTLKSKSPTNPQLRAPIMTRTVAIC